MKWYLLRFKKYNNQPRKRNRYFKISYGEVSIQKATIFRTQRNAFEWQDLEQCQYDLEVVELDVTIGKVVL